ncbi:hypothetical protein BSL78_02349 [Apostichopus japonicus]|uniref:NACHT domain-containing protein n=1 Tax=Stichopus japonicus TaxID=307972 RepID=A0A2G8LKE1_STIJA|nr:hypothetical protein BSL78_02349 [Apostichopus japonicus]
MASIAMRKEYATIGQDVVIDCQLRVVSNVYWYSEKTSFDSPLVKIENEEKVILEAGKGNYDISETGALFIKDIVEERCGLYKVVIVNKDATYEEAFVRLELLNKPQQECLVVSLCDSCYCSTDAKTNHNVSCSVFGARPQVNVSLITENEHLFNVTVRHNTDTDTFDTIAYMEVSMDTCGSKLSVRCTVVGSNIFGIKDSSMDLSSAPCIQTTDTLTDATAKDEEIFAFFDGFRLVIVVAFVVTAVVICVVVIVCVTVCRKGRTGNSKKEYQEHDIGLNATEPLLTHASHLSEGEMEKLIKHLQDRYQSMSYIKPLPWGEKVLIDELYTETICNVTYPKSPTVTKTSKSLFDPKVSQEIKRALFIADIGHGKTTLRQYLACEWSKKELKEQKKEMLLILPLTRIDINTGIGEQLHKTLPGDMNITREQLCDIILKRKCHLLLDGLDEINQQEKTSDTDNVSPGDISLKRLLNESMLNQYPHLRLWVTSRKIDQSNCIYEKPYVEVEILGFNADEIKTYVRKTLNYYKRLNQREKKIKNGLSDSSDVPKDKETNDEKDSKIIEKTISTLDQNDLVQNFKDTPLFIVMFIHIIMSKLLKINGAINELNMNKMSSLVSSIITCLDRRFLEKQGNENMSRELQPLRMKLAKASLNDDLDINEWIKNFDLNEACLKAHELAMAQSVGYIKPIKALHSVGVSKSDYNVFSHDYIQELFIAEYIVSEELQTLRTILRSLTANETKENIRCFRIYRFICGISATTKRDEALKFLLINGCWNTLIDCMFESENFEDINDMDFNAESLKPSALLQQYTSDSNIEVVRLDERYHQNAFKLFMGLCLRSNVHFESISIGSECPLDFLLPLKLPMVDTFELHDISCDNKESSQTVVNIIVWAMSTHVTNRIRFLKGNIPAKIDSKWIGECNITIAYNPEGSGSINDRILDLKSGTWKKAATKKKINPFKSN